LQPKGREFEPRTLHSFLPGSHLLIPLCGAIALAADAAPAFDLESPAYVGIRAVMYLAALLVIGACAFVLLILPRASRLGESAPRASEVAQAARRLGCAAGVVLALAMLARLFAQAYVIGEGESFVIFPILRSTVWGWGWLLGALATIVIIASLAGAGRGRAAWRAVAVGIGALATSFSLTGHAASLGPYPAMHVALDAIHVLAAGGWVGTLLVVATVGLRAVATLPTEVRGHAARELVNAFSTLALVCVGTLAFTGVAAAWSQLPALPLLWQSRYGQTLCVKLFVIALTGVIGAYNWRVVRPRLADARTLPLLRRSAAAELTLGALVVLVTAVLVATSPPDMDDAMSAGAMHAAPALVRSE
jgi:putative copper export protein